MVQCGLRENHWKWTLCLCVCMPIMAWGTVRVDLSAYQREQVSVDLVNESTLQVQWSDKQGAQSRVQFNLNAGEALFKSLETKPTLRDSFVCVSQNVNPRYRVTLGKRHEQTGWPYIFFDKVYANKPEPTAYMSMLELDAVKVVSVSASRVEIRFSRLKIGPYTGTLTCKIYQGSPLIHMQASMQVSDPWVAYIYDSLLFSDFEKVTYKATDGTFKQLPVQLLTVTEPGEKAAIQGKYRAIMAQGAQCQGTVAVITPPHTGVYPLDRSNNYGFLQAGRGFIGTKMTYWGDRGYVPWIDAPQGTVQRMDSFILLSAEQPEQTLTRVLAYTHGDRYKKIPGYYTMAEHFHPEFTQAHLKGEDTLTPFKETMKSLGVQIIHLSEFHLDHGRMHPFNNTTTRLAELHAMYTLFREQSDDEVVLIPGEEYNHYFGGHWSYLFPKPVYFTGWPSTEGKAYKQTNVESKGVTFPVVYQVGDAKSMLQLLKDEGGLAWSAHPRIKDSQVTPDSYLDQDFYKDALYLAGDWKAMPLDLSQDRLGVRGLQLMDDTAQWGYNKTMLGEVDTFKLDKSHEIYAPMNVNYLKLPALPSPTDWTPMVACIQEGNFFTTTGEVLIHDWQASRSGVTAKVEWYFPPAFAEITWGDTQGVHRERLDLLNQGEFEIQDIHVQADLTQANWVRFETWDMARNGAFTQIKWLTKPTNPDIVPGTVTGFTLMDADTDSPVPGFDPIPGHAVLDRSKLPAHVTLRANTSPLIVERVTLNLDGAENVERSWPYCVPANNIHQGLRGCPFYDYVETPLEPGQHVITATPYRRDHPGTACTLTFTVK